MAYHAQQSAPAFASPTRKRVPFTPFLPAQDWRRQQAAKGRAPHAAIAFDYPGQVRQGISMRELRLKGPATPLAGATDPVLAHTGVQRVSLRILWPGYGHVEWSRSIVVVSPTGAPITRGALALQIANNFANWFEKCQYEQPTSADWMVSPNCVQFKHVFLVALHNTFDDVWQADVALDLC